jgi:hypothetical protein
MPGMNTYRDRAKQSFLEWSASLRYSSPLFAALARASATDDDIIELGSVARAGQPIALITLLSAQYLLLKSPQESLASYFPSLASEPKPATEAFPVFRQFCLERRAQLMGLIERRTVNSTMVDRSSCILPALGYVARLVEQPLTLVEICCSAGLNLLFDEYHYDYGPLGRVGAETSTVRLSCKVIGAGRPPVDRIPQVAERVGVDLVKVDASDPSERLWMEAMLCPEWTLEREHLKAALQVRAGREFRPVIGDALEVLPTLLAQLPGALCVFHSYCMGQWSVESKAALDKVFRDASRHRDIHRIGLDTPDTEPPEWFRGRLAKLAAAGVPLLQKCFPSRIQHTCYAGMQAKNRLLGEADGFGGWIDWH